MVENATCDTSVVKRRYLHENRIADADLTPEDDVNGEQSTRSVAVFMVYLILSHALLRCGKNKRTRSVVVLLV